MTFPRKPHPRSGALLVAGFLAAAGSLAAGVLARAGEPLGFTVTETTGAAPGYVADRACALCHRELYESYQEVAMARSFYRPRPEKDIEDFDARFVHEPSGRHYEMERRGEKLFFRRYQLDAAGEPIHTLEQEVHWILGSGNHARTYLYQTTAGELYQLPLAWYSQEGRWGMAPGYDRPNHQGVLRQVRRECMFCHNAYPEVPAGADDYGAPHTFPAELPEGIGCQRCHGPGAAHVRAALGEDAGAEGAEGAEGVEEAEGTEARVRKTIVNPALLPGELRNDICYGCHMQPSVAIPGVDRFGRGDYAFRPGEALVDALIQVDVDEEGLTRGDRFEINHHPYRLEQSRCFEESDGALSCLTCHDPHRKVPAEERAAHYRAACLSCHQLEDCRLDAMAADAALPDVDPADCVSCHMPARRPRDVVRVVMTDHLIRRHPGGPELTAPMVESDPILVGVELLEPERAAAAGVEGDLAEIYRAAAVTRVGGRAAGEAVDHLASKLASMRSPPNAPDPYLDLAEALLKQGRFAAAQSVLRGVLARFPKQPRALDWLAIAHAGQGQVERAIALLRAALEETPERPATLFNLGHLLTASGAAEEGEKYLARAVEERPNLVSAWYHLGNARARLERPEAAIAAWRRALALDPGHTRSYIALGEMLLARGERAEARRILLHGSRAAGRPEDVAEVLARTFQPAPAEP